METFHEKPSNCVIEERTDAEGVTLTWPVPSYGPWRYVAAAVVFGWLYLWSIGWNDVAGQIIAGDQPDDAKYRLYFWLTGWSIGGAVAVYVIWCLVRRSLPESVRLQGEMLHFIPGRRGGSDRANPMSISRSAIRGIVLERITIVQRLFVDRGTDRVEIGECLCEPDREWLFAKLQTWQAANQLPAAVSELKDE
jgi:hypothetical protein